MVVGAVVVVLSRIVDGEPSVVVVVFSRDVGGTRVGGAVVGWTVVLEVPEERGRVVVGLERSVSKVAGDAAPAGGRPSAGVITTPRTLALDAPEVEVVEALGPPEPSSSLSMNAKAPAPMRSAMARTPPWRRRRELAMCAAIRG